MPSTNYYGVVHDAHGAGPVPGPQTIDPVLGQVITCNDILPAPTVTLNTWVRGARSGAIGRVVAIVDQYTFVLESLVSPTFLFFPGGAFTANIDVLNNSGETLNFDSGGTATSQLFFAASAQQYPLANQFLRELGDAVSNSFVPDDRSDTPYYDPYAKVARSLLLDGTTIGVGEDTFVQGNRFTTSGGASGTIYVAQNAAPDYRIWVVRTAGTFNVGDVLTITASGHTATIKSTTGADADTQQGTWVDFHTMPNQNGLPNRIWEFPPQGGRQSTAPGGPTPIDRFVRGAFDYHKTAANVADRGTRVVPFAPATNNSIGGVTLQVVPCSGTFPASGAFQVGETVTGPGGWSAKVHGVNTTLKYVFVYATNGATLTAGTITGSTSGATATATGAAIGWQKGSTHWNGMVSRWSTALSRPGALYSASPAVWRGLLLLIWESELGNYHPTNAAVWPTIEQAQAEYVRFVADLRTHLAVPDLPIALWNGDPRSQSAAINFLGVPYAFYLQTILEGLPSLIPNLRLVRSDGFEARSTTALPYPSSITWFRPLDYLELGSRGWRALYGLSLPVPVGNFETVPVIAILCSQSQQVGSINGQRFIQVDGDPDLLPSASFGSIAGFPGLNTIDPNALMWDDQQKKWNPYDVTVNGNTFFGMPAGTFGPECAIVARMKRRFDKNADAGAVSRILFLKLAVNASSINANSRQALATWDPTQPSRFAVSASCTVTALAATSILPARGRFTAAAGTFAQWQFGDATSVTGSALGLVGFGGNNTSQYAVAYVAQKDPDGAWIELVGAFVNEGPRTFTLSLGPIPLVSMVEASVKQALKAAVNDLQVIPYLAGFVAEQGESDAFRPDEYKAAYKRALEWGIGLFGGRTKGATAVPKVLVQLNSNSPFGTPTARATIRQAQVEVAAELGNAAVVDPSKLPISADQVHRTARGHIMAGFMIDEAFGTLVGIPAHPEGSAAVDFGTDGGGSGTDSAEGGDSASDPEGGGTDFGGTEAPVLLPLVVEDGTGRPDADSYLSLDEWDAFVLRRGSPTELTSLTVAQKQNFCRQASEGIDFLYGTLWTGYRVDDVQAMDWPRTGAGDSRSGRVVAPNVVPQLVKRAAFELGYSLALGVDPLENIDVRDLGEKARFATSTNDTIPGGFTEGRTYRDDVPVAAVLPRVHALLVPLLQGGGGDTVGVA